jgi:hypothetical protein
MTLSFGSANNHHVGDLLPAYHNGTLGADERMRVRAHLNDCAICLAESNEWSAIADASRFAFSVALTDLSATKPYRSHRRHRAATENDISEEQFVMNQIPRAGSTGLAAPLPPRSSSATFSTSRRAAPAALLVVLLAVAIAVIGLRPPGANDEQPPSIPAVAMMSNASPTPNAANTSAEQVAASASAVNTGCDVQPSSLDRLELTGPTTTENLITPLNTEHSEGPATSMDWRSVPTGDPAPASDVVGVTNTVEQFIACANAGKSAEASALFTDDYWRRRDAVGAPVSGLNPRTFVGLAGQDRSGPLKMPAIENAVIFPDGRVGAELQPELGYGHSYEFFIFVQDNGRWLIDEAMHVVKRAIIELSVDDTGFSQPSITVSDGKSDLQLTNTGTRTHSIVIPELNIRIELEPGETETEVLTYEEATLPFYSDMPDDTGSGFTGEVIFDLPDSPVASPAASPAVQYVDEPNGYIVPVLAATIEVASPAAFSPDAVVLIANRDAQLTLTNASPYNVGNFTIDALGIDVDIPVGESVTVTINADPGIYAFYSNQPASAINGMYGTLLILEPGSLEIGN